MGTRAADRTKATPKPLPEAVRHGFDDIPLLGGHVGEQVHAIIKEKSGFAMIEALLPTDAAGIPGHPAKDDLASQVPERLDTLGSP